MLCCIYDYLKLDLFYCSGIILNAFSLNDMLLLLVKIFTIAVLSTLTHDLTDPFFLFLVTLDAGLLHIQSTANH